MALQTNKIPDLWRYIKKSHYTDIAASRAHEFRQWCIYVLQQFARSRETGVMSCA